MALDLSAAALIRAGSGVVYIAAGVLALFLWRGAGERRRVIMGLGIFALATGVYIVPRNLSASDAALVVPTFALIAVFVAVSAVGAILLAFDREPSRVPRSVAFAVAAGSAATYAISAPLLAERFTIANGLPLVVAPYQFVGPPFLTLGAAGLGAWALRVAGADHPPRERLLFAIAILGAFGYIAVGGATSLAQAGVVREEPLFFFAYLLMLTAPTLAGLVFLARGARRAGAILTAGPLSTALLVALGNLVFPPGMMVGIVRSILAGALGYAIFRLARPHATTRRSGALAPVGLAVVFVVAQVAQNFLSAQYGLLMGGVVAGAFLFAASPIQRALERLSAAPSRPSETFPAEVPHTLDKRSELYRRAVRFAIRDGRISPEEELHLFEVAQELGLGAGDAMRIRQDVEREARAEVT